MQATSDLPDGVDPELWFACIHREGARDHLLGTAGHTFPGRMPAWCAALRTGFRVSRSELPQALPAATRYWVEGFLTGNLPRQPDTDDDDPAMLEWDRLAQRFLTTGDWPAAIGTEQQRLWREDAETLSELGDALADTPLPVAAVHIPAALAARAVAAWARGADDSPALESAPQREDRRRVADLALIGHAVETRGRPDGDGVVVDLAADLLVSARSPQHD